MNEDRKSEDTEITTAYVPAAPVKHPEDDHGRKLVFPEDIQNPRVFTAARAGEFNEVTEIKGGAKGKALWVQGVVTFRDGEKDTKSKDGRGIVIVAMEDGTHRAEQPDDFADYFRPVKLANQLDSSFNAGRMSNQVANIYVTELQKLRPQPEVSDVTLQAPPAKGQTQGQ